MVHMAARKNMLLGKNPSASQSQSYVCVLVAESCLLLETPRTIVRQAPLSMGFSRQECWSGLPFPSAGDLPHPGIEPRSPALQADSLPSELPGKPLRAMRSILCLKEGKVNESKSTKLITLFMSFLSYENCAETMRMLGKSQLEILVSTRQQTGY